MTPKLLGGDTQTWANRLTKYLDQVRSLLVRKVAGASAKEDGVLLWDAESEHVVVSHDGIYKQLGYKHAFGSFTCTTTQSIASSNTAYSISFNQTLFNDRIAVSSPDSRIEFSLDGTFLVNYQVDATSTSGGNKMFYLWMRKNGTDIAGSATHHMLTGSHSETITSIAKMVEVVDGDYIEVMYAANSTSLEISSDSGTAFSPSTSACKVIITQVE